MQSVAPGPVGIGAGAARAAGTGIAVVGTGVVGLATALGCAQLGIAVALIGPAPRSGGAGELLFDPRIYAISQAARGLLTEQRVWSRVDPERSCAVSRMKVFGDSGGALRFDARAAGVERLATICEESQLLQALWLGCSMAPGITHHAQGFAAAQFDADPVRLRLQDGTELECALLLGADGKASSVRAAAGIGAQTVSYGHTAFVANFSCELAHQGVAYQWFTGDEGIVALLPLPGKRVSLVWSAPPTLLAEFEGLTAEAFAGRVARRSAYAFGDLAPLGQRHAFALQRVVVDRLVGPGVALLGDAAHVVHPLAGQGLNLGLQDVAEFLRLMQAREPWRGLADRVWLRRYERARAEPIALMRGTVGALAQLFGSQDVRVRRLRNLGLSAVDALAPLKHALIRHAMG
jgi:ubiquinone biosynthesis UbiH/UbiF/VisC/COQ6 family hydroxylase